MNATPERARLHIDRVEEGSAERWVVFLHGILGSGENWSGFARRLVAALPGWGAMLIDLRLHGRSGSGAPPHTVDAAARDVATALAAAGIAPAAISGHSFGSKVAFRAAALLPAPPERVWLLDADPGPRPAAAGRSLVLRVIDALRELPREYARRDEFTTALRARGFSASLAGWLGKNLERDGDRLRLAIDVDAIEEILADFHAVDLWPEIGDAPFRVAAVIGGRSDVFAAAARRRLEEAATAGEIGLREIPEAGHWLHIDAPRELLGIFEEELG